MEHKLVKFLVKTSSFLLSLLFVVVLDQTLDAPVWSLSRVVGINVGKLLNRCEGLPVFVESEYLFFRSHCIAKNRRVLVLGAHFFFLLFFFVQLLKQLVKHRVEVGWLFRVALKDGGCEVFLQLALGNIGSVAFVSLGVAKVFSFQNLVSVGVVPGPLLVVHEAFVGLLYLLKHIGGITILVFVWMPLKRCPFVSLNK